MAAKRRKKSQEKFVDEELERSQPNLFAIFCAFLRPLSKPKSMSSIAAILPLAREFNDLKRLRVAGRNGSLAQQLFERAWTRLLRGEDLEIVAQEETVGALVSTKLAGIDARTLRDAGLSDEAGFQIIERAFDEASAPLEPEWALQLGGDLAEFILNSCDFEPGENDMPEFIARLANQPRAGATRPGFGRVVLEPAENHAEHCAIVAVLGVVASSITGAGAGSVFLTGLCHHLHNAYLPDAGDAGDALLGEHLKPLMETFRARSISQLPPELQTPARDSLDSVFRSDTPQSRAFQIADSLDRVLEMEWHARSANFTLQIALDEMDIIHPGPVQKYQLEVMREAGFI